VELQHTFTVPAPIEQAWSTLLDVEGIAPCFPGAALTGVSGDEFSGTVKVKLGPVSLQYAGKGRFVERDEAAHRLLLEANGSDKRGNGTAGATVTARLEPDGDSATTVVVETDLKVTGRPAQFGRGVLQDVGGKIIDQFATCLASRMAAPPEPSASDTSSDASSDTPSDASGTTSATAAPATALANGAVAVAAASADESAATTPATAPAVPDASESAGEASATPTPAPPAFAGTAPAPTAAPEQVAELDLGAVVLPTLAKRYGPAVLAGLLAVFVVWLVRRRTR
jgi:carbon monoxide dehydrogenase subunit G